MRPKELARKVVFQFLEAFPPRTVTINGKQVEIKGVHAVRDRLKDENGRNGLSLNETLRALGVEPISFLSALMKEGAIVGRPAKGGFRIFAPDDRPTAKESKLDITLNILGLSKE